MLSHLYMRPMMSDGRSESGIPNGERRPLLEEASSMPLRRILPHLQHRFAFETYWLGIRSLKNPFDAWIYQEIIVKNRPDVIIEIGCYEGGGAWFLAHICDLLGHGRVIGVDAEGFRINETVKKHPRIEFIIGKAEDRLDAVLAKIKPGESVMVIEDSAHDAPTCLKQLQTYGPVVTKGQYYIVEDTIHYSGVGGVDIGPHPGSSAAVYQFMQNNQDFEIDRSMEAFVITWCVRSFLKKIT